MYTAWFIASIFAAWASSVPEELVQAANKRELAYRNRCYEWLVRTDHRVVSPRKISQSSSYVLKVRLASDVVHLEQRPTRGKTARTVQGQEFELGEQDGWITTSFCYLDKEVSAFVENSPIFGGSSERPVLSRAETIARIRQGGSLSKLYKTSELSFLCNEIASLRGCFIIGLNPVRILETRWKEVKQASDRWILVGSIKAKTYDPKISEDYPDVSIRVELRKGDALPLSVEIIRPLRSNNQWQRASMKTKSVRKLAGIEVPDVIEFMADSSTASYKVTQTYKLVDVQPLVERLSFELPMGTAIADERLGFPVNYRWQGRLPTEEELKEIAYQHGNLIPQEASSRRHSPILFVPAVIFFALAAYFYFRGRRR
ncbi:MAG: hypothetical protein NZ874_05235 [Fimbriimonadales bacterium]|nr:hypothetical protein [Fimbriimonadales bacterium]